MNSVLRVLRFDVDRDADDPSQVPSRFYDMPLPSPAELAAAEARKRIFNFERLQGAWAINGQFFDPSEPHESPLAGRVTPERGSSEIWVLRNSSGGWQHPIHIHFEEFQILSRNGQPPPPHEAGRKDIVRLRQNEEVRLFLRFRDFVGRFPMHCHNTIHEDHAMMLRWDIVG